jgi:hypothetical protein
LGGWPNGDYGPVTPLTLGDLLGIPFGGGCDFGACGPNPGASGFLGVAEETYTVSITTWMPFLLVPQAPQVQGPQQRPHKTGNYWDYVGCVPGAFILEAFGNDGRAYATVGLNIVAVVAAASGNLPAALTFGTVAAIWDAKVFLATRADCRQAVYGR